MRVTVFLAAAAFALATTSAMACPMQTAAKSQTVASSGGNSTPIPTRSQQPNNG